jgi:hypothetical protein
VATVGESRAVAEAAEEVKDVVVRFEKGGVFG